MPADRRRLAREFREQQRFADGYSPLYATLFGIVTGWLDGDPHDSIALWLIDAAAGRTPLETTLLLMAGLHRDVLAGEPGVDGLARHYPTTGGRPAADPTLLAADFRAAILARRETLAAFIQQANVQTNETARGLAWLLPATLFSWPAVHLIELGASAGLNLVAERRAYRLVDAGEPAWTLLELGHGFQPQFIVRSRGAANLPAAVASPAVLSRVGGDLHPFHLHTADDELTLAAFVWADQVERMARLREGIAALRAADDTAAPARLVPLRLPDELPDFLAREGPHPPTAPVVIYNTTVSMYLPQRGAALRDHITAWAAAQSQPVLWLQWEPSPEGEAEPPEHSWLAWTADYWPNDGCAPVVNRQLAWVHPHGTAVKWLPNWSTFLSKPMQN